MIINATQLSHLDKLSIYSDQYIGPIFLLISSNYDY